MTTSLFLRTYDKDAPWLRYCLRSLDKFGSGFHQKIIVTPESSHHVIQPIAAEFGWEYDTCPALAADDYIGQQGTKLMADHWCSGDNICFIDSDLVFFREFTPDLLVNDEGKIVMLKTRYASIQSPWKAVTEHAVGYHLEWEYMRRLPLTHPRSLFHLTREHLEKTHNRTFENFIAKIAGRKLSEFNILGAIADKFAPDMLHMIDTDSGEELPPLFARQFWSWGGITPDVLKEIEAILA